MRLETETHDDLMIVDLQEERLDAAGAVTFKEAFRERVKGHEGRVALNLSTVEFLDSSGLGALVAVMKMLNGRKLEVAGAGHIVRKVLTLTRMDRVFVMHADRAAAISARDAA